MLPTLFSLSLLFCLSPSPFPVHPPLATCLVFQHWNTVSLLLFEKQLSFFFPPSLISFSPEMASTGAGAVRPSESRTSRTGRVLKAPRAYVPAPNSSATGSRPRKEATIVCAECGRGHTPKSNMIVFCDGCDTTWHQKCHDPIISDHVVDDEAAEWHCRRCKPVALRSPVRPEKVKKAVRPHPRTAKGGPRLEVSGAQLTVDKRRAYLSRLSHAELLELTLEVSVENPQVPMFPRDMAVLDRQSVLPQSASLVENEESRSGESDRSESPATRARGESVPAKGTLKRSAPTENEVSRKKPRSQSAPPGPATAAGPDQPISSRPVNPEPSEEDSDEEVTFDPRLEHRRYPRPGNGLALPANDLDLDILREHEQYPTFSHQLGRSKRSVSFSSYDLGPADVRPLGVLSKNLPAPIKSALKPGSTSSSMRSSAPPAFNVAEDVWPSIEQTGSSFLASPSTDTGWSNVDQAGFYYPTPPNPEVGQSSIDQAGFLYPSPPSLTYAGPASGVSPPGVSLPGISSPGLVSPGLLSPGPLSSGLVSPDLVSSGLASPGLIDPSLVDPNLIDPGLIDPNPTHTSPLSSKAAPKRSVPDEPTPEELTRSSKRRKPNLPETTVPEAGLPSATQADPISHPTRTSSSRPSKGSKGTPAPSRPRTRSQARPRTRSQARPRTRSQA